MRIGETGGRFFSDGDRHRRGCPISHRFCEKWDKSEDGAAVEEQPFMAA